MIQSNNRPFKNKPLSNIQQAQFSIGWRFCPVCGHKLYQKDESCSGTIRIKCLKCGNVATVDLAYRKIQTIEITLKISSKSERSRLHADLNPLEKSAKNPPKREN